MIENILNNKRYIGYNKNTLEKRFKQPCSSSYPVGIAIRKYGKDKFSISLLEESLSIEEAVDKEIKYISEYGTFGQGYNCSIGGERKAPIVNLTSHKSKEFSHKMKIQATNQHNNPIKKQKHIEGIREYWKNLPEDLKNKRIKIARDNGKKNIFAWNKGKKFPGSGMVGAKNPNSKNYKVFFPDGKIKTIKSLKTFCESNNLTYRNALYVLEGKQKHHKNFRFARLENHS